MRIVYFGSGAFGLPTLRALAASHTIAAIVTQPDRPAGRGHKLSQTPVAQWAAEHLPEVPILKPEKASAPDVVNDIRSRGADAFVVIAFGQKLSPALLDGVFAINLHASLLPRWRGAAPINAAILAGDSQTGNSVITLAERIDAGLILGQSRWAIEPATTAGELHDLLAEDGPALVSDVLRRHAEGRLRPVVQDESLVTIAPKMSKRDAWIDFHQPASIARQRTHAYNPWPGVTVMLEGQPLKLLRVQCEPRDSQQPSQPGLLVDVDGGLVECAGPDRLRLVEVQPAGGRAMPWSAFIRGHRPGGDAFLTGGPGA
ncbi:MAG: methionyl-tRNA formyltransferase [Phycisphaerales bacterium]|nr:methionyl-tRNA formyltransferase [Phycisphaerales bacterium]